MTGVEEVVRADPRRQEAMRRRGVTDFDLAMIDPWPAGYYGNQDHYDTSRLLCCLLTFMRAAPSEPALAAGGVPPPLAVVRLTSGRNPARRAFA